MDKVKSTDSSGQPTLMLQFAKMMVVATTTFMAGKMAERAFDRIVDARQTETEEDLT